MIQLGYVLIPHSVRKLVYLGGVYLCLVTLVTVFFLTPIVQQDIFIHYTQYAALCCAIVMLLGGVIPARYITHRLFIALLLFVQGYLFITYPIILGMIGGWSVLPTILLCFGVTLLFIQLYWRTVIWVMMISIFNIGCILITWSWGDDGVITDSFWEQVWHGGWVLGVIVAALCFIYLCNIAEDNKGGGDNRSAIVTLDKFDNYFTYFMENFLAFSDLAQRNQSLPKNFTALDQLVVIGIEDCRENIQRLFNIELKLCYIEQIENWYINSDYLISALKNVLYLVAMYGESSKAVMVNLRRIDNVAENSAIIEVIYSPSRNIPQHFHANSRSLEEQIGFMFTSLVITKHGGLIWHTTYDHQLNMVKIIL